MGTGKRMSTLSALRLPKAFPPFSLSKGLQAPHKCPSQMPLTNAHHKCPSPMNSETANPGSVSTEGSQRESGTSPPAEPRGARLGFNVLGMEADGAMCAPG
ncbi:hypothetical protein GCM10009107_35290 [Ideonella azotifigens]|uniref:Uncharacterized protein n=1 Tax=Ideonella azotifigens TaxID=513160 RepID=A0ABN1K6R9_9BURK